MSNTLKALIGGKVTDIFQIHDSWRLELDIGGVNSYNPLFHCKNKKCHPFEPSFCSEYIGSEIVKVKYRDKKNLMIVFDNKNKLIVSLIDEDFTGPEALFVHLNSGVMIVIN